MNWKGGDSKRGVFFTLDAVFAILILVTLFSVFMLLSVETVSTENIHQMLRFQAEDAVVVLAKTKLWEVRYLPVVQEMEASGALVQIGYDYSVMEAVGALWATDTPANNAYAAKLIEQVLGPSMPSNTMWEASIEGEKVYSTGEMANARFMSTVSNRLVSGYMKGQPHFGYTARAFLSNIRGKGESAYLFFGGFTGQGNITGYIRGIPADATITGFYIEARAGSNFTLRVNDTLCPSATAGKVLIDEPSTGYLSESLPECAQNVSRGSDTKVFIEFEDKNISGQYFGGGFIRVEYNTADMGTMESGKARYYFLGISGVPNIFDSFYVPGDVTGITGFINISTKYEYYLNIGNATIYRKNGSGTGFDITPLSDSDISGNITNAGLTLGDFSNSTFPVRFGTPEATFLFGGSDNDVVMVTDVSGSMAWCEDQLSGCCGSCNPGPCNCPSGLTEQCGYETAFFNSSGNIVCADRSTSWNCKTESQKKIESVIEAENEFAGAILNPLAKGNRLGVVDYSSSYAQGRMLLPDINVLDVNVDPDGFYVKRPQNHTYNITLKNDGFAPPTKPFTVAIFFPDFTGSKGITPLNVSFDPAANPLPAGGTATISVTIEQNVTRLGNVSVWADCGGAYTVPKIGYLNTVSPGLCPAGAGQYGIIEEYLPNYDGFKSNNVRNVTVKNGVNLIANLTDTLSTPINYSMYVRYPLLCASSSRNPYNQTLYINFTLNNTGALHVYDKFNVTLKRYNLKCNYWETVNLSKSRSCTVLYYLEGYGNPTPQVACWGGVNGNPMTFISGEEWMNTFAPILFHYYQNTTMTFPKTTELPLAYAWDIENYTPPTCPAGANCTFGADCNDIGNMTYYDNRTLNFDFVVEVDPQNYVPESSEADNNATKLHNSIASIYLSRPDIRAYGVSSVPSERCSSSTVYEGQVSYGCYWGNHNSPVWEVFQYQTYMSASFTNDGYCPVLEPFNVTGWTRDQWCVNASISGSNKFTQNCPWVQRGSAIINKSLAHSSGSGTGNVLNSSGLPLFAQYTYSYTCYVRSVGVRNMTFWTDLFGYSGSPDAIPPNPYNITELDEQDNQVNGTIAIYGSPDLTSFPSGILSSTPAIQPYKYGFASNPINYTACFYDPSPGRGDTPVVYMMNETVAVTNALYTCPANSEIWTRLYTQCTTCASFPTGPTGGSCSWINQLNFTGLAAGETKLLSMSSGTGRTFTNDFSYCSVTDIFNSVAELSEDNNHGSFTITKRPTDLVPGTAPTINPRIAGIGVTLAANGTVHTCYGAKANYAGDRYVIYGYTKNNGSCSFSETFTAGIGVANSNRWTTSVPFFGPYVIYKHNVENIAFYNERLKNITTSFPNGNLGPGAMTPAQIIYWDGKAPNGKEDYVEYYNRGGIQLYYVVNEPYYPTNPYYYIWPSSYRIESNYSNNWYTDPAFAIEYEAPDIAIYQMNKSRNDATQVYTINVSVLNNDTSPGRCNTSLQNASFRIGIWENVTTNPVLINSTTITNLEAGEMRVISLTTHRINATLIMNVTVDDLKQIFESNENNNFYQFNVFPNGAVAPPAEPSNPVVMLSEKSEGRNAFFESGTGVVTGSCSLSANPTIGGPGTFSSTIGVISTITPSPLSCTITCYPGGPTRVIDLGGIIIDPIGGEIGEIGVGPASGRTALLDGVGRKAYLAFTASCPYPAVATNTVWTVSGVCGSKACSSTTVTGRGTGSCSGMTATPNIGQVTLISTIEATFVNAPPTVNMYCYAGAPAQNVTLVSGKGNITCTYSSEGTYFPYSSLSGTTCNTTVTVTSPATPTCNSITPNPSGGTAPLQSTVVASYTNPPARVDMKCSASDPLMSIAVSGTTATALCNYTSAGTYRASSNYSGATCTTSDITVVPDATPFCNINTYPPSGDVPFASTVEAVYTNTQDALVNISCNSSGPKQQAMLSGGRASIPCTYESNGTYTASSDYVNESGTVSCSASVTASPNFWADYGCPDGTSPYMQDNFTYMSQPIFADSIIREVGLTDRNNSGVVYDHIAKTQTNFDTCICCGILEAVEMITKDPFRQGVNATKPASIVVMTDGQPTQGCGIGTKWQALGYVNMSGDASNDTITAACYAFAKNITVNAIGFGGEANNVLLNDTASACGGKGSFYPAGNASALREAYLRIAADILNVSYTSQSIEVSGTGVFNNTVLSPDSYLEFTYQPYAPPLGWNEITMSGETAPFSTCTGNSFVLPNVSVYEATATSYSSSYWTSQLKVNGDVVYDLDRFTKNSSSANPYRELGDPFNIRFGGSTLLNNPASNEIDYSLKLTPTSGNYEQCGTHNKLLYKGRMPASVPFMNVMPNATCRKVKVYYDLDDDGDAGDLGEGGVVITMGDTLVGIDSCDGSTPIWDMNVPADYSLIMEDAKTNALTDSMLRLLDQLNYNHGGASQLDKLSGHPNNPVDVYIDPNTLAVRASSIYEVPYMWGPVDVAVKVWIN